MSDDPDSREQLFGRDVLEQEAARAGDECVEYVLVEVEGREHQHAGRVVGGDDPARCLEPVHDGHPDVHQHDVGPRPAGCLDGLRAVVGLSHDARSRSVSRIIRKPARTSAWSSAISTLMLMPSTASATGSRACTANPSDAGPVRTLPSYSATRRSDPLQLVVDVGDRGVTEDVELESFRSGGGS